jgi:hypothetical protein
VCYGHSLMVALAVPITIVTSAARKLSSHALALRSRRPSGLVVGIRIRVGNDAFHFPAPYERKSHRMNAAASRRSVVRRIVRMAIFPEASDVYRFWQRSSHLPALFSVPSPNERPILCLRG